MSGKTGQSRVRILQAYGQHVKSISDIEVVTTGFPDNEGFCQESDTEEVIVLDSDSEKEADSRRMAIVASVETHEVECLHLATKAR